MYKVTFFNVLIRNEIDVMYSYFDKKKYTNTIVRVKQSLLISCKTVAVFLNFFFALNYTYALIQHCRISRDIF